MRGGCTSYRSFAAKGRWLEFQKILYIKENQIFQVKEFRNFSTYGKMQESGLSEIIPLTWPTSLVAQMIKNLCTMRETWVQSLGWEGQLEKEMATHSSILAWKIPWTEQLDRRYIVHGVAKSWTPLRDFTFHSLSYLGLVSSFHILSSSGLTLGNGYSLMRNLPLEKPVCMSGSNS